MIETPQQAGENELALMLAAAIMRSRATRSTTVERGGFVVRENRHENGLVEVAVYVPDVLSGAGKVPRAIVTRGPGGRDWSVLVCAQRVWVGRSKRRALEFALTKAAAVNGKRADDRAPSRQYPDLNDLPSSRSISSDCGEKQIFSSPIAPRSNAIR